MYPVPAIQKFDLLIALLKRIEFQSSIIFFQTRNINLDKISYWLVEHGNPVKVLHSDLKQKDRVNALEQFKKGNVKILCATDVVPRGPRYF